MSYYDQSPMISKGREKDFSLAKNNFEECKVYANLEVRESLLSATPKIFAASSVRNSIKSHT